MRVRLSRRAFIRWVIAGTAAACLPEPLRAALEKGRGVPAPRLGSEGFSLCHDVRDGVSLPDPAPSLDCGVIVVGGGPSGLAAADRLAGTDFLLLEKEPAVGGNCTFEEWEGLRYGTGAAWCSLFTPEVERLFKRWGFELLPISGYDAARFEGVWIDDFWNGRPDNPALDKLPYPRSVRDGFKRFASDIQRLDLEKEKARLDSMTFASALKDYPPQLAAFWDSFGPSNWGAKTGDTSAYAGLMCARDWPKDKRYSFEGGMGVGAKRIYDQLPESDKRRVRTGAAVYRVRRGPKGAVVNWFEDGSARTARAKAVVMAAPKFMARRLVEGLPEAQSAAMGAMRYAPYLMVNLCFERAVWSRAYDNYPVGARSFTDFIPADFVRVGREGKPGRRQVITVYCPLDGSQRHALLDDGATLERAEAAAAEFCSMVPDAERSLREVRVFRRGHAMPMAVPGGLTRLQPAASADFPPVFFAASDSAGEISDLAYAAFNGIAAAEKALRLL